MDETYKSVSIKTGSLNGSDYIDTLIEVTLLPGKFKLSLVGLNHYGGVGQACVSRVTAALFNNNIKLLDREYIINISPANSKKYGTHYDLPIVAALLYLNGYISPENFNIIKRYPLFGEFSLTGKIVLFQGLFSLCLGASSHNSSTMIVPAEGMHLIDSIPNTSFFPLNELSDIMHLSEINKVRSTNRIEHNERPEFDIDMSDIYGQEDAKRALEIVAAGKHHCILSGPPGCGKTMLAKTLPTILPLLNRKEQIEVNSIYSSAGLLNKSDKLWVQAPFRSPHHSSTIVGLVGGGKVPFPGDVTLAHNGVLFLDEFLELSGAKIEMLRQVLEDRKIDIKKNDYEVSYPASFMLVAAFNSCPCGYYGSKQRQCVCTLYQIKKYMASLSGPILDRIDLQINIDAVDLLKIDRSIERPKTSPEIAQRVETARQIQYKRYGSEICNSEVSGRILEKYAQLSPEVVDLSSRLFSSHQLSMRGYHKVLRVARTIADLANSQTVEKNHFEEALSFKKIEKLMGQL